MISTVLEAAVFIASVGAVNIFVNQIGFLGSECFKYTMLFTPISISILLLFALNKGIISKLLTNSKLIIYIGNISAYTFLIHQMVIRYIDVLCNKLIGDILNPYLKAVVAFTITILCSEIYIRLEHKMQEKHFRIGRKGD